jgi:hypothetical protein
MTTIKPVRKTTVAKKAPSARPDAAAGTSTRAAAKAPPAKVAAKVDAPVSASAGPRLKQKLVRDSFTIPKAEYAVLEGLKVRAANLKRPTKKSELLRAGVAALQAMTDKAFLSALSGVASLKTGRPKGTVAND